MSKITVIDSIDSSALDQWSIQYFNENPDKKFIYVTPFIDRADKFISSVNRKVYRPENVSIFAELMDSQENIAITHFMFMNIADKDSDYIKNRNYTVIIDDAISVINLCRTKRDDALIIKNAECGSVDDEGLFVWNGDMLNYDTQYNRIRNLAARKKLILVNQKIFLQVCYPEIFSIFDDIYILTYLFDGSIMKGYFGLYDIPYEKKSLNYNGKDYFLTDYQMMDVRKYSDLINVYEGNMNKNIENTKYGDKQKRNCLSLSWYRKKYGNDDFAVIHQIKNNLGNYYRNIVDGRSKTIMWTTFKECKDDLKGNGYSRQFTTEKLKGVDYAYGFLPCNSRSEKYSRCYNLAYCMNSYLVSPISQLFKQNGLDFNDDLYSLREMLRWIWKSRIQYDESINIYIPSERMRKLLYAWMNMELEY